MRCVPQVHGASRDAVGYVYEAVSREINAVTDNPLIFPEEDEVISGGNFHGQPMALAFDFLKNAVAELADISERRSERLINPQLSEGLEPFLTKHGGVCSGFMIAQYAAASMVSENKIYAHPASVDLIPVGNQEDHVSMTTAWTAAMILTIPKSSWIRTLQHQEYGSEEEGPFKQRAAYDFIRKTVKPVDQDIIMHYEIKKFDEMIKTNEIVEAVEKITGPLK